MDLKQVAVERKTEAWLPHSKAQGRAVDELIDRIIEKNPTGYPEEMLGLTDRNPPDQRRDYAFIRRAKVEP